MYQDLIDRFCHREQGTDENLGYYIEESRLAVAALCVEVSEGDAVMCIVEGI